MLLRVLAVILAGASMRIVSPPIGLYEIHWLNLIPAFWAMRTGDNAEEWLVDVSLWRISLGLQYNWVSESVLTFSNLPDIRSLGMCCSLRTGFCHSFLVDWVECALVQREIWSGMAMAGSSDFKWRLNKRAFSTVSVLPWSAVLSIGYHMAVCFHFWRHKSHLPDFPYQRIGSGTIL